MKFPFVTRAWHEAEIAEEKHAVNFQKQRRNYWKKRHSLLELEAERRKGEILELKENLRGVISQRDMASKNYQRIMDDHAQTLIEFGLLEKNYDQAVDTVTRRERAYDDIREILDQEIEKNLDLKKQRDSALNYAKEASQEIDHLRAQLAPFLRKRGQNGKFVPAQPKESGQ